EEAGPDDVVAAQLGGLQAVEPVDDAPAILLYEDRRQFRRAGRVKEQLNVSGVRPALPQEWPGRQCAHRNFPGRQPFEILQIESVTGHDLCHSGCPSSAVSPSLLPYATSVAGVA